MRLDMVELRITIQTSLYLSEGVDKKKVRRKRSKKEEVRKAAHVPGWRG